MIRVINNSVQHFDVALILYISKFNGRRLIDRIFYIVSKAGDGYLYILIGMALAFNIIPNAYPVLFSGLLAFAIELPVYSIVKKRVKRERPFEQIENLKKLIMPPDKYSFPSGHTAAAFVMATIFTVHLNSIGPELFILASLIGFSRVYLRVHYPSDILAGAFLGTISANLSIWLLT